MARADLVLLVTMPCEPTKAEMRRPGALERVSDLRVRQALSLAAEALELVDDMSPYVPEYFCEKWGYLETYADLLVRLGVLRTQA